MKKYWLLLVVLLVACGDSFDTESSDTKDDSFLVSGSADSILDVNEATANAILEFVNTASLDALDDDARLDRRAAENIVSLRPIASLEELDAVPYVGKRAFGRLVTYVVDHDLVVPVVNNTELLIALAENIDALEAAIDTLGFEITSLEDDLYLRQNRINNLLVRIEGRKEEVRDNYEEKRRTGMFLVAFGCFACGVYSYSEMLDDDHRLDLLESELQDARSDRDNVNREISRYESARTELRAELRILRDAEDLLRVTDDQLLTDPDAIDYFGNSNLGIELARIANLRQLQQNLGEQVVVLNDIKNLLVGTSATVAEALLRVEASSALADELVIASDDAFARMLEAFTSADPNAAATQYLEKRLKNMLKDILGFVPTPAGIRTKIINDIVRSIAKRHFDDISSDEAKEFIKELKTTLRNAI